MEYTKASPQEIYEVLEEQKKLLEIRDKFTKMLDRVNQTINSLTVENLQLTQSIELSDNEEQLEDKSQNKPANIPTEPSLSYNQQEQSDLINQQMIEIDLKPCFNEEIESDEELEHL